MIPLIIFGVLALSAAVIAILWDKIRIWVEGSLFPFLHNNFPHLEKYAKEAFAILDDAVVKIRIIAKKAWEKLRQWVLKIVVEIEKVAPNEFTRKVKTWIVKSFEEEKVVVNTTEESLEWDNLPSEMRAAFIKAKAKNISENVTEHKDQEFEEMSLQA